MFLDLCFTAAQHGKQTFNSVMTVLASVSNVKTDLVNTLVDLHQRLMSRGFSVYLPTLQSVFQSTPAVWCIDLSERKTSSFLQVLELQSEKKQVKLKGCSHEDSEVGMLLNCLPRISKLRYITILVFHIFYFGGDVSYLPFAFHQF